MSEANKVTTSHLRRSAFIYVRQSSPSQVEFNRESTDRQYKLPERAQELGWQRDQVQVIDEDMAVTASGLVDRGGFEHMATQVALGHVGIIIGIEVARLARNNADWYRLLDLCGATDTLIGDADGLYHPGLFNDRLLLGLKGTMSEAELHVLRARLNGGIRNKAARGELRRGLPVGYVWGESDGEVRLHPDEAVTGALRTIFERFAEMGSARQVWLWFRSQGLSFPLQSTTLKEIRWVVPTYTKIHQVLTNPVYAGAYVYGKTRQQRYVDDNGKVRKRLRKLPRSEWAVLIRDHHEGFINWETFEANQTRIAKNTRPRRHESGTGAVREGAALLQGIAICGRCGRKLSVHYTGKKSTPGYHCAGDNIVNGKAKYCLNLGGQQVDQAVAAAFLETVAPAGLEASLTAAEQVETHHDAALEQWQREVERTRYQAQRAERRYRAVDPDNRLVARGLEAEWERCLRAHESAAAELARREQQRPRELSPQERNAILALGTDLDSVWAAATTTDRERKELLRTLLDEVMITVDRDNYQARLMLRWQGGLVTDIDLALPRSQPSSIRTSEETVELVRRLAVHHPDDVIAGILNRQGRKTARGLRFTAIRVCNVRNRWDIPRFKKTEATPDDKLVNIREAAKVLDMAPSTLHRWINDGFIAAEQTTPGAPWRIRLTDDLRSRFVEEPPEGYVPMIIATRILGVSRQTVLQRVKRGELQAVLVARGRRKGLRIRVPDALPSLFDN